MMTLNEEQRKSTLEDLAEGFKLYEIPASLQGSLESYIMDGIPTGGFLRAVLTNDLKRAVAAADLENRPAIHKIVMFLYNHVPAAAWGSESHYKEWIRR